MNPTPMTPDAVNGAAFTACTPVFTGLTPAQADGLACVACGADYLTIRIRQRPIGRSQTGAQVFVCSPACAVPDTDTAADTGGPTAGGDAL